VCSVVAQGRTAHTRDQRHKALESVLEALDMEQMRIHDFASMPGREDGPRLWRGEIRPRAESSLYRTGALLYMDKKRWIFLASRNGERSSATLPPFPLRTDIKTHKLYKEMPHLGQKEMAHLGYTSWPPGYYTLVIVKPVALCTFPLPRAPGFSLACVPIQRYGRPLPTIQGRH
jgi:hypothetical protein